MPTADRRKAPAAPAPHTARRNRAAELARGKRNAAARDELLDLLLAEVYGLDLEHQEVTDDG